METTTTATTTNSTTTETYKNDESEYDGYDDEYNDEKDDKNEVMHQCHDESEREKNMKLIFKRATFFVALDKDTIITAKNRKIEILEERIDELQRKVERIQMQLTTPRTRMQSNYGEWSTERITSTTQEIELDETLGAAAEPFAVERNTTEFSTGTSTEEPERKNYEEKADSQWKLRSATLTLIGNMINSSDSQSNPNGGKAMNFLLSSP